MQPSEELSRGNQSTNLRHYLRKWFQTIVIRLVSVGIRKKGGRQAIDAFTILANKVDAYFKRWIASK